MKRNELRHQHLVAATARDTDPFCRQRIAAREIVNRLLGKLRSVISLYIAVIAGHAADLVANGETLLRTPGKEKITGRRSIALSKTVVVDQHAKFIAVPRRRMKPGRGSGSCTERAGPGNSERQIASFQKNIVLYNRTQGITRTCPNRSRCVICRQHIGIIAGAAGKGIRSATTSEGIVARSTDEGVGPVPSRKYIVSRVACNRVRKI